MITLTEDEKRMVFQLEGCHRYDAIQEIAIFCRYTRDHGNLVPKNWKGTTSWHLNALTQR